MPSKVANACKAHNMAQLESVLNTSNINQPDMWGRHPLYYSVRYRYVAGIHYIVASGGNPSLRNTISGQQDDILVTALKTNDVEVIRCVMGYMPQIDISEYFQYIFRDSILPVFLAGTKSLKGYETLYCQYARAAHYEYMYTKGICFDIQQCLRYTLLHRRVSSFLWLLKLVRYSEQLNYVYRAEMGQCTCTLSSLCATYGYTNLLQRLLTLGADPNIITVNHLNETQNNLMVGAASGLCGEDCILLLLRYLDINWQNSQGQTALMMARRQGRDGIVELLLGHGARTDLCDMDGRTYLEYKY